MGRARRPGARAQLPRQRRIRREIPRVECSQSRPRRRVGAMGWSQGGYISAFLATHDSTRFKAISVGAGISDWMTYYVNTDIHPFTRQYLKATPWDDPEVYRKTSPITD